MIKFKVIMIVTMAAATIGYRSEDDTDERAHQNKPEPLGMLLKVAVLNLETDTEVPPEASSCILFWEKFTGSTAGKNQGCMKSREK